MLLENIWQHMDVNNVQPDLSVQQVQQNAHNANQEVIVMLGLQIVPNALKSLTLMMGFQNITIPNA